MKNVDEPKSLSRAEEEDSKHFLLMLNHFQIYILMVLKSVSRAVLLIRVSQKTGKPKQRHSIFSASIRF